LEAWTRIEIADNPAQAVRLLNYQPYHHSNAGHGHQKKMVHFIPAVNKRINVVTAMASVVPKSGSSMISPPPDPE
jgi:hypothetical protein